MFNLWNLFIYIFKLYILTFLWRDDVEMRVISWCRVATWWWKCENSVTGWWMLTGFYLSWDQQCVSVCHTSVSLEDWVTHQTHHDHLFYLDLNLPVYFSDLDMGQKVIGKIFRRCWLVVFNSSPDDSRQLWITSLYE